MKKWLNRLLGDSDEMAIASDVASAQAEAAAAFPTTDTSIEIEAAYYRWLSASAGYSAPADTESLILGRIQAIGRNPADAAELVPRVPEVIPQLLRSLRDEDVSAADLARQVAQDVLVMAEVIREANSAYYRPMTPVKTIEAAIMMLGQNGLRMLLARIAFRPAIKMQPEGFARRAAPHIWSQSEKSALAASLLAPGLRVGVFESYLAGLMQNVGVIVGFRLADGICPDGRVPISGEFGVDMLAHSRQLSACIAMHWDFPQEVIEAIAQAGQPGQSTLAQALAHGDRIAKLRMLIDGGVLSEDDTLVTGSLDNFERRCLGKLRSLDI